MIIPRAIVASALTLSLFALPPGAGADENPGKKPGGSAASSSARAPVVAADGSAVRNPHELAAPSEASESASSSNGSHSSDSPSSTGSHGTRGYREVEEYWTAERMANARPLPMPGSEDARGKTSGKVSGKSRSEGATDDASPSAADDEPERALSHPTPPLGSRGIDRGTTQRNGAPGGDAGNGASDAAAIKGAATNGRVFFRDADGKDHTCSASAVNSGSRNLVITAGHCVHGGPGKGWHANWVFVPGYENKARPHGVFQARALRTYDDWIANGESDRGFNSDVGFATVFANENGERVVDAVGGHGLVVGGGWNFDATVVGYPVNLDGGERLRACSRTTGTTKVGISGRWRFHSIEGCDFGQGASGGPWLANYDGSGMGDVRSVTSFGPADGPPIYSAGPRFRSDLRKIFDEADGDE